MKLKTFHGATMADALAQVKREFGRQAVILNTRTLTRGSVLGIGGKPYVEITAARRMSDLPAPLRRGTLPVGPRGGRRAEGAAQPVSGTTRVKEYAPRSTSSDAVLSEVSALREMVSELVRETRRAQASQLPSELYDTYQRLVSNAVADEAAGQLVSEVRKQLSAADLQDPKVVRAKLADLIRPMLPVAGPIRITTTGEPYIVALTGPTGVGKTTTIAKLAANFRLRENRKVGLITIDTYRIAAVQQLQTYAEIIDVPLEVAASADQLKNAVANLSHCDVILIDTAGRSQRDRSRLRQLHGFFTVVKPHEIHLVLSSTCSVRVLNETIERFREVGIDRVIFTKLDEALGFGVILGCLQKADAKLSYITTGQDVPSDIAVGESRALARLILGEREVKQGKVVSLP